MSDSLVQVRDPGEIDAAKAAFQQAVDSGQANWAPNAAFNLGVLLAEQGEIDAAKAAYQEPIDSGHADWASKAAVCLRDLT